MDMPTVLRLISISSCVLLQRDEGASIGLLPDRTVSHHDLLAMPKTDAARSFVADIMSCTAIFGNPQGPGVQA